MQRRAVLAAVPALAASTLIPGLAKAQPAPAAPAAAPALTPEGERLQKFLDGRQVASNWRAGQAVDWKTGAPDRSRNAAKPPATHAATFVAAVATLLGVPVLSPPAEDLDALPAKLPGWLSGPGAAAGWRPVAEIAEAQRLANTGELVVAVMDGGMGILRPAARSAPALVMAGRTNNAAAPLGSASARFFAHKVAWM